MGKNLWASEKGTKAIDRPQKVSIGKKWAASPDVLPTAELGPRRRKLVQIRPNNRAAVSLPLQGQSYNPTDEDHQQAMKIAVRQLEKKKTKHQKFVREMLLGRTEEKKPMKVITDSNWEEEVKEVALRKPAEKTSLQVEHEARKKNQKQAKLKKQGRKKSEDEVKRSFPHRRHPGRVSVCNEAAKITELVELQSEAQKKLDLKRQKRREAKKENMQIKHYGRHYHTPLVTDVATSDQLVGSLRHLSGGNIHPAMERMKSLEERNLVPARMRHSYNKRRILKAKGEVKIKTEPFGLLPSS